MKQTRILMGMPITVEIADESAVEEAINNIFTYFEYVESKFSVYKQTSEISLFNKGEISEDEFSDDMKKIFELSEETKKLTNGYFDIKSDKKYDPSGLVKGWAIYNAAQLLKDMGFKNFYVEAGGDIQAYGKNGEGQFWKVGIKNPFEQTQIVKAVRIENKGIATSGTYIRGQHIYNPKDNNKPAVEIISLTVIGPNIYEADRFATAAFAMGKKGIEFIEGLKGFEGYMIDYNGTATMTGCFEKYVLK